MSTLGLTAAAGLLHMSEDALMRKARAGIVPGARKTGRKWHFDEVELSCWLDLRCFDRMRGMWAARQRERIRRRLRRHRGDPLFKAKNTFYCMGTYARRLKRVPPWANLEAIKKIYLEAKRKSEVDGTPYEVDHEIPLQGEIVSGLHVENNLRIAPKLDNRSKGNRFQP